MRSDLIASVYCACAYGHICVGGASVTRGSLVLPDLWLRVYAAFVSPAFCKAARTAASETSSVDERPHQNEPEPVSCIYWTLTACSVNLKHMKLGTKLVDFLPCIQPCLPHSPSLISCLLAHHTHLPQTPPAMSRPSDHPKHIS